MIDKTAIKERLESCFSADQANLILDILAEMSEEKPARLYSVGEIAQSLKVSESLIRKAVADGSLRCVRFGPKGGRVRCTGEQVAEFVEANTEE